VSSRVEAEGNSIDEAIENALRELGIPRERAQVEILQDARKGLLGFGGQKARVRVSVRGAAVGDESTVSELPRPVVAEASDPAQVLREILTRMGFEGTVEGESASDGVVTLRVSTGSSALLIGRHGQTLDAVEYLVNRIVGKQEERGSHVVVDCEGYRERHQRELRETATRLADKVRQRGKAQTMIPMSPRDRRIVHLALSGDATIVTRSVGQGYLRRVVIAPARAPRVSTSIES
jgi:spoIIIJ-associated protein